MKEYRVEITNQTRIAGESCFGVSYQYANTAAGAIKLARKEMRDNGYTRQDGPFTYSAKVVTEKRFAECDTEDNSDWD